MNQALYIIAERRIAEAIKEGTLNTQSWKNKPLPLERADGFVPEDLRMAYKILKNAGYLPPEVETRKEVLKLEDLIEKTEDAHLRIKQIKKLNVLLMKLDSQRSRPSSINNDDPYYRKVVEKISSRTQDPSGTKT